MRFTWGPDTATRVLVVGGTGLILISLVLGLFLGVRRRSATSGETHFLLTAHMSALHHGLLAFALSLGLAFSQLAPGWETAAAWLIVLAGAFSVAANLVNYARRVQDQFVERGLGLHLATANAVLILAGVLIVFVGVLRALTRTA